MWKKLTIDDLRTILSEDELERLKNISVDGDIENIVNNGLDLVSDTWRGALGARGYTLDVRSHYTPPEYHYWVLTHARWAIWTRFPNTPEIALDKAREIEYKKAMELLKNPYLDVSKPDYSDDPTLSGDTAFGADSITVPPLRFRDWYLY